MKLFARSFQRYNGGVRIKRLYGSSTITLFHVGIEGSDPSTWATIEAFGKTPGERKTNALDVYKETHPEHA